MERAGERIQRFLAAYPEGRLLIAVGYATPAGLTWLQEVTDGRPVSLLIGDIRFKYWRNHSMDDAMGAAAFLTRPNVNVRNWYRTSKSRHSRSEAHLKTWVVEAGGRPIAGLAGSANLIRQGLKDNIEVVAEAFGDDLMDAWEAVRNVHKKGWNCEDKLLDYLEMGSSEIQRVSKDSRLSPLSPPPPPLDCPRPKGQNEPLVQNPVQPMPSLPNSPRARGARWRRWKKGMLYVLSGLFALGAISGAQAGDLPGVVTVLILALLLFIWARRTRT